MKTGDYSFRKQALPASNNRVPSNYGSNAMIVAPNKVMDLNYANDEDFWYGDKKDKRLGRLLIMQTCLLCQITSEIKSIRAATAFKILVDSGETCKILG